MMEAWHCFGKDTDDDSQEVLDEGEVEIDTWGLWSEARRR